MLNGFLLLVRGIEVDSFQTGWNVVFGLLFKKNSVTVYHTYELTTSLKSILPMVTGIGNNCKHV